MVETLETVGIINIKTGDAEKNVKSLKQRLKEVQQEMQQMAANGDRASEAYQRLAQEAGELAKAQREVAKDVSEASTTFSNTVQYTAGALAGVSGAVQTVTSALSMMGVKMGDDSKLMQILVSAMAMTSGLQAIQSGVEAFKLLANNIKKSTLAQKGLNAAIRENPIGLIISAAAIAIGGLIALIDKEKSKQNELNKAIEEEKKARVDVMKTSQSEIRIMDALIAVASDTTRSYNERKGAIKELNKTYPELQASLVDENGQLKLNTQAYIDYKQAIIEAAKAKAYQDKVSEWTTKELEYQEEVNRLQKEYNEALQTYNEEKSSIADVSSDEADIAATNLLTSSTMVDNLKEQLELAKQNRDVSKENAEYYAKQASGSMSNLNANTVKADEYKPETTTESKDLGKEYTEYEKRMNQLKLWREQGMVDERVYTEFVLDEELKRLKSMGKGTKEYDEQLINIQALRNKLKELPDGHLKIDTEPAVVEVDNLTISVNDLNDALNNLDGLSFGEKVELTIGKAAEWWGQYGSTVSSVTSQVSSCLNQLASDEDRSFEEQKKLKVAAAVISTLQGALDAFMSAINTYGATPWGLGIATGMSALVTATGMAQINQIKKQTKDSASVGTSPSATSTLSRNYTNTRLTDGSGAEVDLGAVADKINNKKVYVTVSDINEAQQQVRVTKGRNTF